MISIYTLATKISALEEAFKFDDWPDFRPKYQAHPGDPMPIILQDHGAIDVQFKSYGVDRLGDQVNIKQTLKRKPHQLLIRNARCAVPANCFFIDSPETRLVKLMKHRLMAFGGLYVGDQFMVVTTPAPDILQKHTKEVPLILRPDQVNSWLKAKSLERVFDFAERSSNHWFDMFKVDNRVLDPASNSKDLLKPIGPSLKELSNRTNKQSDDLYAQYRSRRGK